MSHLDCEFYVWAWHCIHLHSASAADRVKVVRCKPTEQTGIAEERSPLKKRLEQSRARAALG